MDIHETIEKIARIILRRVESIETKLTRLENQMSPPTSLLGCNCSGQKVGESTGGWWCPRHGQQGIL